MNIHEYQGKELFRKYGIPVPKGEVAYSSEEAYQLGKTMGSYPVVVKAQIHAGGRGKAGGVKLAFGEEELKDFTEKMLGMTLVTHQTGPEGKRVQRLLIEEGVEISKEFYIGFILNREMGKITLMVSSEGGMDIEEVAEKTPGKLLQETIEPSLGLSDFQCRRTGFKLGLKIQQMESWTKLLKNLYRLYTEKDASVIEINPLILNSQGEFLAIDAKVNIDDNGLFRQEDLRDLRDEDEENPKELEAAKYGLSYIALDGKIGCMVNGAGLAMATMDTIKHYGGEPANFLDVGGSATKENVAHAFRIIMSDEKVRGIFVNIFGGIMKCDVIAEGIVEAVKETELSVPLVVRLEGTNVEKGRSILRDSSVNVISVSSMDEGAERIIAEIEKELRGEV